LDVSDAPALTCARCGAAFTPRPDVLARYPGWTPKECPACYRAARSGSKASRGSAGAAAASSAARSGSTRTAGGEQHLTRAEVLETYHDGPDTGVFTDGSSIPNPGPGGWGAVYVKDGEVIAEAHGHEPQTTNNRMELRALQAALELVPPGTPARIHTDSNLAVRTITEWAAGWERRGWARKTGPVENLDLVKPLYEAFRDRPELELVWIKAHAGNRWNEYADALATAWAREEL
jgi:ribonuclease HI